MKPLEQMTDEELRVEIAEFCGWTLFPARVDYIERIPYDKPARWQNRNGLKGEPPNYPQDLNAMWEAEQVMIKDFGYRIFYTTYIDCFNADQHATAKQRAIAFVKTIREIKK